jgi:hypothetical protein
MLLSKDEFVNGLSATDISALTLFDASVDAWVDAWGIRVIEEFRDDGGDRLTEFTKLTWWMRLMGLCSC